MPPYQARFSVGANVRIAEVGALENFRASWSLHHALAEDMLVYAGRTARVREVGYYHGGDVLYQLHGIPGTWHEQCLHPSDVEGAV